MERNLSRLQNGKVFDIRCLSHTINLVARDIINTINDNKAPRNNIPSINPTIFSDVNTSIRVSVQDREYLNSRIQENIDEDSIPTEDDNLLPDELQTTTLKGIYNTKLYI